MPPEVYEAVDLAEAVVYWAEHVISLRSPDPIQPADSL